MITKSDDIAKPSQQRRPAATVVPFLIVSRGGFYSG
jgi:hypothetical protein